MGPDPGIASLRPGDKFHFNREPFIRQHLVVPEKPFASDGEYNRAFSSDGGCGLAVRPALPPLPTAPVPPPRTKRRARHPHAHHHGHHHGHHHVHSLGQPPMPPARTRRAKEAPDTDATCTRSEPEDDGELNPNDSILSPAHTMELLKRMAKVEARLGRATAAVRARSVDSLGPDALELGLGSLPAARFDGPRSLDLDLNKEHGVVGLASSLALQSWHERRPWSPPLSMSNSAVLLSPRQWRPLGSSAGDTVTAAPAALATSAPAEVGASSSSTSLAPASRQTASTMALSEFIKDTYDGERKEAAEYRPMSTVEVDEGSKATAISETGSITLPASVPPTRSAQPEARIQDSPFAGPPVVSSSEPQEPTPSPDSGRLASSHIHYLDVPLASTEVRAGSSNSLASSASSTTESLGELEDDILHMLSLAEPEAGKMQDQKDEVELPSSKPAVQQKQSIQNDSVPVLS